ncbi:MAG: glycerol-3-phosphate cytidyltransferase TagD [Microgenomates group bacterium GW2011_GWC1_43_11]|uniref:Glycerol-3-phosphate cytidyltransferase TagD n=2 Tax=Candidatus Gottesmaniibacteriota TaxID=1752720 RepID=A0A0G1GM70_9BACT|nr:MAG: glycerol-3-phosphate cytidyltransferase TagD [Microgenomates group bacterium GW2011_GWC1_43_11]KKT35585.1 MAG: Glycerol-3-phosphate cytidyltransferase TagD [Candidatus Gottesmanbacteria bacterium GW2011_GWB1_44_11c]HCM82306.1 glycerol-3-phosphate cytidylyltransferase [Patescibacteria group bacterium]
MKNSSGANNCKVVLVGGCFDLLHYGHIAFLKEAKKHGDYLIVLLESDENVRRLKGEGRPFHTQKQRKEMLESLSFVDEVRELPTIQGNEAYYDLIKKIRPSIIALTEGDPKLDHKMNQAEQVGAQAIIIPKIHTPSTSQLAKLLGLE